MKNILWCEKYRPNQLTEVVGEEVEKLSVLTKAPQSFPHLILTSKTPGTGKTTIAKILMKEFGDALLLNASDERGIDTVREKIKGFAMSAGNTSKPKLVVLDEADGLTGPSQDALRSIIETYHSNCRFVLTCNFLNKLIEPIRSRCIVLELSNPPEEKIVELLNHICEVEKVEHLKQFVDRIVEHYYPSMRNMINKLQELSLLPISQSIKLDAPLTTGEGLFDLLQQKKFMLIREQLLQQNCDYDYMLKDFFQFIIQTNKIIPSLKKQIIQLIAMTAVELNLTIDKEITFSSFVLKTIQVMQE